GEVHERHARPDDAGPGGRRAEEGRDPDRGQRQGHQGCLRTFRPSGTRDARSRCQAAPGLRPGAALRSGLWLRSSFAIVGRMRPPLRCIVAAVAAVLVGASGAAAADDIAIVDAHVHYSQNSWQDYAPGAVLLQLDQAGVRRAFLSSTPDDGTIRLYDLAPDRI